MDGMQISIHAPAWGATELHRIVFNQLLISIHAPAWGATICTVTVAYFS